MAFTPSRTLASTSRLTSYSKSCFGVKCLPPRSTHNLPDTITFETLTSRVRDLIERVVGASVLFLAPYSPNFSPIKEAFSKLKAILRWSRARSHEALLEAMGRALDAISYRDALGWFEHCGYDVVHHSF